MRANIGERDQKNHYMFPFFFKDICNKIISLGLNCYLRIACFLSAMEGQIHVFAC